MERGSNALDMDKYGVGVFLDHNKAFEPVYHTILLIQLEQYGIRGKILRWFKRYLSNRSQNVEYNNTKSDTTFITHSVPQGYILEPLLFIICMNEIFTQFSLSGHNLQTYHKSLMQN